MTETKKIHNFSAGPCILPRQVLEKSAKAVIELDDIGLSLIEISHRSKEFISVMEKARALVKELLNVPENYSVLFLQGGASLGFLTAAHNFMRKDGKSAYTVTGEWARKAAKEAKYAGEVDIIATSEDKNFNYIPKNFEIPANADYLHLTSNNTIFGTQFKSFPESSIPIICDMSSDIFSRKIDVSKFALIYAGAQKNMGTAGTTLYIVNNDLLGKTEREIPSMLNLQVHIDKDSMFNTPPVFAVYTCMLTLEWLKSIGGVDAIEEINNQKADLIYGEIDRNPLFEGTTEKEDRSIMNATFVLKDETHKEEFDKLWQEAGISGIKGHRSVGGYRASMYNALPLESVQVLVDVMQEFETKI
ncbi:MAG: 3-phosphoserine/phosphohydroxythreonine aminotransferase [Flavobacteriales bacterium]|nr:MAG: 3-phosphoserine/phosphohydroxythreonine aminotransferase [Flavobacteriales bacterium]